ncbi:MAG: type IX secretion system protein PorQ [Cyclobacteriaceae bacterium]
MRKIISVILCSVTTAVCGQVAGSHAFDFLNVPAHARLSALGGVNVSLADKDLNFFHNNPSLAGDTLNGLASASYLFYVGDVGQALFSYSHDFKNIGPLLFGVQHLNYGSLKGFDETGMETMEFQSGETALVIAKSHQIGNFRLGASIKGVFSTIGGYRASALLMDAGGIFKHPAHDLTVGLTIKNAGIILSDYSINSTSHVPLDVQAGFTIKPDYMPVRFSLTAYNLLKRDVLYYDSLTRNNKPTTLKKVFSHLSVAAEILFHRNFNLLVGYNYLTHETLKFETGGGGAGVSFGFSVMVKPVEFVFSRSGYFAGNAGYSFTLSTNINKLLLRR